MTADIMEGKICPYCHSPTEYTDSIEIYGRSYGMIYICRPCDAYCGVHKGTVKALGRLANKELRHWKKQAHTAFDQIWLSKRMKRNQAYRWLSDNLNIPTSSCHIGMFDVEQCKAVVELSKKYLNEQ
ncbi:zinc-finger-containing protein [Chitinophaga sp. Hz27]|uniref:zinc-finger-containing protein n=1 Tax=Chitinophaga sp. Hz27 TaxID=3347169 RepID=UPI0035D71E6E